ncbi:MULTISPECIES: cell division topological specificity factor MinE [Roseobacteraceae]|uniref:cell division topological specificity factor MinE n=1 Tax=Roseobacteraceae TaxID=2854170 RepID=UPI00080AA55F|nr:MULTISPECIES: cell division topological specificity factor MinE [Roseobacteraceae]ANT61042.1 cell division topological specificity factor MinE [Salipiger sp. CCB-MM3]MCA0994264.1 cell division topological specificity factor MinE [Alloyangia pacifica]NDW00557.1 cell division topological specificity factor MinE [Salipiger sp. PrR002]NDW57614.1 cell division topological specificity factor MinE [Salipiger sp. PrR004]
MKVFGFTFNRKPKSSAQAKERLQILLAHERGSGPKAEFLPLLQRDILEAIKRYVEVSDDAVGIRMDSVGDVSSLEINIELPAQEKKKVAAKG